MPDGPHEQLLQEAGVGKLNDKTRATLPPIPDSVLAKYRAVEVDSSMRLSPPPRGAGKLGFSPASSSSPPPPRLAPQPSASWRVPEHARFVRELSTFEPATLSIASSIADCVLPRVAAARTSDDMGDWEDESYGSDSGGEDQPWRSAGGSSRNQLRRLPPWQREQLLKAWRRAKEEAAQERRERRLARKSFLQDAQVDAVRAEQLQGLQERGAAAVSKRRLMAQRKEQGERAISDHLRAAQAAMVARVELHAQRFDRAAEVRHAESGKKPLTHAGRTLFLATTGEYVSGGVPAQRRAAWLLLVVTVAAQRRLAAPVVARRAATKCAAAERAAALVMQCFARVCAARRLAHQRLEMLLLDRKVRATFKKTAWILRIGARCIRRRIAALKVRRFAREHKKQIFISAFTFAHTSTVRLQGVFRHFAAVHTARCLLLNRVWALIEPVVQGVALQRRMLEGSAETRARFDILNTTSLVQLEAGMTAAAASSAGGGGSGGAAATVGGNASPAGGGGKAMGTVLAKLRRGSVAVGAVVLAPSAGGGGDDDGGSEGSGSSRKQNKAKAAAFKALGEVLASVQPSWSIAEVLRRVAGYNEAELLKAKRSGAAAAAASSVPVHRSLRRAPPVSRRGSALKRSNLKASGRRSQLGSCAPSRRPSVGASKASGGGATPLRLGGGKTVVGDDGGGGDGDEDDEDDQGIVVLEASTAAGTSSAVDKTGRIKRNLERQNRQNAMPGIISKKARKAIVRDFITSQRREAVVTSARQWQEAQREQALPPVTMADVRQWVAQSASIAHPGSERMRKVPFDCRRFFPLLTRPSGGAALVELMLSCVNRELDTVEVALAHAKAAASASSGSAKAKAEAGGRAMRHSLTAEAMEAEVMAALAEEEEDDED